MTAILGISAFYHDAAAALVIDGEVVAAAQEERFSRKKHDARYPANAARFCLEFAGLEARDVELVAFYDKPLAKVQRLLETYFAVAPRGFRSFRSAVPTLFREKLFQKRIIVDELRRLDDTVDWGRRLLFSEHHLSHAASAFYPSPFERAAVLTMDGVGEWATASLAMGEGNRIEVLRELHFPHSLGLLYSAFTYYLGFKVLSGEYKVMGLAPYGVPRYAELIRQHLIDLKPDGTFRLDLDYFDYCTGLRMTGGRFHELFGGPPRDPATPLTQREMDLAASIQTVTEDVVIKLGRSIAAETGAHNLCLAGGVALNCVANGKLQAEGVFERIWIQPAAGDAGGALGAALAIHHLHLDKPRRPSAVGDAMKGSLLGPQYSNDETAHRLENAGARFSVVGDEELLNTCATALAEGKAIGWHQGRMEFGPRALGARSILADARSATMQRTLNLKVKYRESFRPFAPSVLREEVGDWFELDTDSPYMLLVAQVKDAHRVPLSADEEALSGTRKLNVMRSTIPAVTHVDYSARVQTVNRLTNPRYHALISRFKQLTGCSVIVNTSFNVRGEPIACTPEDSFRCFMGTGIELLAVENCILRKEHQVMARAPDYASGFELD